MKAITLTQPWATLVAIGAKRLETRSWQPRHLGPIGVHAAKGFPIQAQSRCYDDLFYRVLFGTSVMADIQAGVDHRSRVASLPRGAVIAIARLEWAEPTSSAYMPELLDRLGGPHERELGDYGPDRWAWYLADVRPLPKPVPAKGALHLWEWTPPDGLLAGDEVARR